MEGDNCVVGNNEQMSYQNTGRHALLPGAVPEGFSIVRQKALGNINQIIKLAVELRMPKIFIELFNIVRSF